MQPGQLAGAAHERAREAPPAAGAAGRDHGAEFARGNATLLALRLERARLAELEGLADERGGALADEYLAGACRLLESRRDVHGIASRERAPFARAPDDDLASVHANPQREAVGKELPEALEHPQRGLQRPLRVVLLRGRSAEHGDDRVSDEFFDRPPAERDLSFHRVVEALEEIPGVFGIELAGERRGADEIGEQDRRQLPLHRPSIELEPCRDEE
ncbi:MAG TPA: hypothetical protein VFW80_10445 [Gaiellaceae bacterium]|nr:hypothetical protein [Gaiellaceae bacterium]